MIKPQPNYGHQVATCQFSNTHRGAMDSMRRLGERESGPRVGKISRVNREMLAIWSFVVFSFAALLFCIFILFAKCHSDWPFGIFRKDESHNEQQTRLLR